MKVRYGSAKAAIVDALRALQSAFGGAGSLVALLVVSLVAVSLGWFSDVSFQLFFAGAPKWAGMVPLLLIVGLAAVSMRRLPELAPHIDENLSRPARGMVMFLSPTKLAEKPGHYTEADIAGKRDSWEMPYRAIKQHWNRATLEAVVVIPSADSGGKEDGTWRLLDLFRRFIADATGMPEESIVNLPEHRHGVDFESARDLWQAVEDAMALLRARGIEDKDIVIDITGGQKLPAMMGGVASLGGGARIQYVSTRDHRILEYDVTMRIER